MIRPGILIVTGGIVCLESLVVLPDKVLAACIFGAGLVQMIVGAIMIQWPDAIPSIRSYVNDLFTWRRK